MKDNIALKIRIYPTKKQKEKINKNFGCVRFVYNGLLSIYKEIGKVVSYKELYSEDKLWLQESDTSSYSNVQLNLRSAINNHYKNPNKFGLPIYKSKHNKKQSYVTSVTNNNSRIIDDKHIKIPKVGVIKAKVHRRFSKEYKLKSVTIERDVDKKYYAVLLYEYERILVDNQTNNNFINVLSIDYSMEHFGVLSNGEFLDYPKFYKQNLNKLQELGRAFSKCTPHSNNWLKRKEDIARLSVKIKHQREDFLNKLAKTISGTYDVIAIEDLDLQEMSKSNHYGKSIYDNAYGMFIRKLEYKLNLQGKKLIKVGKYFPSSKRCSLCGNIKEHLELSERIYKCSCGNIMNRDYNAALNIGEEVIKILFQEEMDKQLAMFAI